MSHKKQYKGYVVHLLHPAQHQGGFVSLLCGRQVHKNNPYNATKNPRKVTCIKCQAFIENPFRSLRRYGRLTIIEPFGFTLTGAFGFKYDIMACSKQPGHWNIYVGQKGKSEQYYSRFAPNTRQLAFHLLDIIEKELIQKSI